VKIEEAYLFRYMSGSIRQRYCPPEDAAATKQPMGCRKDVPRFSTPTTATTAA
jgi:hypothetical protein